MYIPGKYGGDTGRSINSPGARAATGSSRLSTAQPLVYTLNIPGIYSLNDSLFSVPAANPSSSGFGCPCHWDVFRERNDGGRGRSFRVSCMSGTALPGYFQFQACPARPHSQEQESQVCIGVEQNKNYDSSRRCDCWWIRRNGTLPSSATPATGWSIHA